MVEELPGDLHRFPTQEFPRTMQRMAVPLALLGLYLGLAGLWILVSNRVGATATEGDPAASWVQSGNGIAFMIVTATIMSVAVGMYVRRVNASRRALEDAWDKTLLGWALALDARETALAMHSQRVADLTLLLARHMKVPDRDLRDLYRGALLHDVGKLAVPEAILNFPGRLDEEQWAVMRQHPDNAVRMLAPIEFLTAAMVIPQSHHEKWDGTGYPQRLAGEDIPYWARIFAVVDVYDAITSKRSYHDGAGHERAMQIIREESGRHFDPAVVEAFQELMRNGDPLAPIQDSAPS